MRKLAAVMVLVCLASGAAFAQAQVDDSKLSPEAKALKAKYDAMIQDLQSEFTAELQKLTARVEEVEAKAGEPAKKKWYDSLMINGYFQARFHARDYEAAPTVNSSSALAAERDDFDIRRLYVNAIAPVGKKTLAVITWAGVGPTFRAGSSLTSNADWANIFVEYNPTPEWKIRLGQAPTWFGLDTCESSSCRFTPERFAASEGISALGLNGLYFAGPWDRGLWIVNDQRAKTGSVEGLRTVFSVHNGQFRNQDADDTKNISLDAEYFTEWGQFGASWLDGKFAGMDRNALGLNLRLLPNVLVDNWGFQAEYIDGEWFGADTEGWYGQASYHFDNHPGILYTRYEEFDPNTNAANNEYEALHLGYKYALTANDEITVEYTDGDFANTTANDFIVQWQRMF